MTFCHFLSLTCCPTVVRCQGDFHSHTLSSHFISGWLCANILSIHSPLNYFPCGKREFLSSRLTIVVFVFVRWKVNSQSFFSPCIALVYPRRVDWAVSTHSSVSASPCFTFTQSHTRLPWELPSITKLLSGSTGADGIKGKGSSAAFVLFLIFLHSACRCLKLCLVMHRFRLTNGALSIQADHWGCTCISSFIYASQLVPHSLAPSLPAK